MDLIELLKRHRSLFLLEGIVFTILGIVALMAPMVFSWSFDLFLGWLFLVGGIVLGIRTVQATDVPNRSLTIANACLYILVGLIFLAYPTTGILALDLLLGCFFVFDGMVKITSSVHLRPLPVWGWVLFSGILSLIIAFIILANWPANAAEILGLLVGINLLFSGLATLGFLWSLHRTE